MSSIKPVSMHGVADEIPSRLVWFSVPYRAEAQGVDPLSSEPPMQPQAPSRFAVLIGKLGRALAGLKISLPASGSRFRP